MLELNVAWPFPLTTTLSGLELEIQRTSPDVTTTLRVLLPLTAVNTTTTVTLDITHPSVCLGDPCPSVGTAVVTYVFEDVEEFPDEKNTLPGSTLQGGGKFKSVGEGARLIEAGPFGNFINPSNVVTFSFEREIPKFSVSDVTVNEIDGSVDVTIALNPPVLDAITSVTYATADESATAGEDYDAVASTPVFFFAGETSKTVSIQILDDLVDEVDETFRFDLSSPTGNAAILDPDASSAVVTIIDDDASPTLAADVSVEIVEGPAGSTTVATITVTKTGQTAHDVTVQYDTADDTAIAEAETRDIVLLPLKEQDVVGVSGWAMLKSVDGNTEVTLMVSTDVSDSEKVHIHAGRCGTDTLGDIVHHLTDFVGGASMTTLEGVTLSSLRNG